MERRREGLHTKRFHWLHSHHLIYNTCWEDPRLDHIALNLGPGDTLLTLTSAGCHVLDDVSLLDRITLHTCSLTTFLETYDIPISRMIFLDHMDRLSTMNVPALQREWQAIVNSSHTLITSLRRDG